MLSFLKKLTQEKQLENRGLSEWVIESFILGNEKRAGSGGSEGIKVFDIFHVRFSRLHDV